MQNQCENNLVYHPALRYCTTDTKPCDDLEFKCVTTGRFPDPFNPNKYIWCLRIGGAFLRLNYSCPIGKVYDGINTCVDQREVNAFEPFALYGAVGEVVIKY